MKTFMFVFAALLLVAGLSYAQTGNHNANVAISVDVSETPLDIENSSDLAVVGVTAGTTTTLVPDGADAFIDGASGSNSVYSNIVANSTPGAVDVTGDPSANVLISFALPSVLNPGTSGNGVVFYTTNGTSACYLDEGGDQHFFNPAVPTVITLTLSGDPVHINLGGIFTVPENTSTDVYFGDAIVTVAYTAN